MSRSPLRAHHGAVVVRGVQIAADQAWQDIDAVGANRHRVEQHYRQAADDVDLVVFPELALSGYIPLKGYDQPRKRVLFEAACRASDELAALARATAGRRAAMVVGLMEPSLMRNEMHNSAVLLQDGEVIAVHRKLHLPVEENHYFVPGDQATVADCRAGRIGLAICYDIVFPEVARLVALQGAEVLVVPSNWAGIANLERYGEILPVARALEEQLHVVFVNGVGALEVRGHTFTLYGRSRIVSALGDVVAEAGPAEDAIDGVLTASDLAAASATFPVLRDRRPSTYRDVVEMPSRFSALAGITSGRT